MCATLYRVSATIAAEHPELADQVRSVERHLYELGGQLLHVEPTADIWGLESGTLRRLLQLYEKRGVVEQVELFICPQDGEILEMNEDGILWCDICDGGHPPEDCAREIAYRVQPSFVPPTPPSEPLFPQGYALLIGIGAYDHLRPLDKTTGDAQDLYDLFTNPLYAGYPRDNVALLLDNDASKGEINNAFDWLAHRVGPEDTVVVFFAGHGARRVGGFEPGEYLCPVEADWNHLRSTAISTEELSVALRALQAGRVIVFLDACHSGGVGQPREATLQVTPGLSEVAYSRLAEGQGRVIIASCRPEESSWEFRRMRNGVFTHHLLEALRGAAAGSDGTVRILDLFKYVSTRVPKYVSEHTPEHEEQHPLFKGELQDDFVVALAPGKRQPP